jgi:hypothetical protein
MQPCTRTSPCLVGALISTTLCDRHPYLPPVRTTSRKANTFTMRLYTIFNTFVLSLTAISVTALSLPERRSVTNAREFTYSATNLEELTKTTPLTSPCRPTHHHLFLFPFPLIAEIGNPNTTHSNHDTTLEKRAPRDLTNEECTVTCSGVIPNAFAPDPEECQLAAQNLFDFENSGPPVVGSPGPARPPMTVVRTSHLRGSGS